MAEEIVACPGCGKKFRIPEGAPGGTFQCTACNASVPYGKAAQKPAAKPGTKAAPAARGGAPVRAAPAAHHGAGARHAARHARAEPEEEEHGHGRRHAPDRAKRDQQLVLWLGLGGIAVVAVGAIFLLQKDKAHAPSPQGPQPVAQGPQPVPVPVAPTPEPAPAAEPPASTAPASGAPGSSAGDGTKPAPASGIGGASASSGGGSAPFDPELLFVRYDDIEGVTPQEREVLDRDVVLLCDRESAKAGVDARNRLKKQGRRAVPALLSAFATHWKGAKWESDGEKFASYQVQQLLMEITKADRPRDFLARYDPRVPVEAKDFQTAAKMWTQWWVSKGKSIEKFKDFAE